MSDVLTMEEIEDRFDQEWVLLDDPTWTGSEILSGKLLYHSKDRDEVWRKAHELPPPVNIAVLYIGRPPEDVIPIL